MSQDISSIEQYQINYNETKGTNLNNSVWIGDIIYITYDDCIDYYDGRSFNELWFDGSSFNYTLLNYKEIIHETCAPTVSPTNSPSSNPTTSSPTISSPSSSSITTTDEIQFEAPINPTKEPTNKFSI